MEVVWLRWIINHINGIFVILAFARMQTGVGAAPSITSAAANREPEQTAALGSAEQLLKGGNDLKKRYQKQSSTGASNYSAPTGKPNLTPTIPDLNG